MTATPSISAQLLAEVQGLYDDFVRSVADDAEMPIDYRRCGSLEVATDEESVQRLQRARSEVFHQQQRREVAKFLLV